MKNKVLNTLVILSSLFGYLEWGEQNSTFLFQAEYEVLKSLFTDISAVAHPLTLLPLLGQLLLLITLFQKKPSKALTYIGITCLSILLALMLVVGVMIFSVKIIVSVLPFFILVFLIIRTYKQQKS